MRISTKAQHRLIPTDNGFLIWSVLGFVSLCLSLFQLFRGKEHRMRKYLHTWLVVRQCVDIVRRGSNDKLPLVFINRKKNCVNVSSTCFGVFLSHYSRVKLETEKRDTPDIFDTCY